MDNQTNPEWLTNISEMTLGTGIFLVPNVYSERFGEMEALAVPDLTYETCIQRGTFAVAFQWVPYNIASFDEILAKSCNAPCEKTCTTPGCICNQVIKRCKRAIYRGG